MSKQNPVRLNAQAIIMERPEVTVTLKEEAVYVHLDGLMLAFFLGRESDGGMSIHDVCDLFAQVREAVATSHMPVAS
jgi:hypothetical protein